MRPHNRTLRTTLVWADAAAVLAGAAAGAIQAIAGLPIATAVAIVAAAAWVGARRVSARARGMISQVCFLAIGVLMVSRLSFRLLPLAVGGTWLLVAAADLDRFVEHFPVDSPVRVQRAALRRRLALLGSIALVATAVVALALALRLQLRLTAVIFIAVFVVFVLVRVIDSIRSGEDPGGSGPE
jgi:hypothetical protein